MNKKSVLDGYGVRHSSLIFDLKCLLGTVTKVGHDDTVVEGGTGAMEKKQKTGGLYWNDPKTEKENTYYGKKFIYWRKYQRVSK